MSLQDSERLPETPARPAENAARWAFVLALGVVVYAVWAPNLELAATWTEKLVRVLPRMSVFVLAALSALILSGGRPSTRALLLSGAALGLAQLGLLPFAEITQPLPRSAPDAVGFGVELSPNPSGRDLLLTGAFMDVLRFELSVLSAVLLGMWLGRGLASGGHFLALLLCGIAGDVWLSSFRVPELAGNGHVLSLLRVPWPPALGNLGLSPAWTDLLILSAVITAAGAMRFHMLSVVTGAVAGYCGASFLGLGPWPAWPALSMVMCASGILIGTWPDLKCSARESAKAVAIAGVLFAILIGVTLIQSRMNPPPEMKEENYARFRNVT
ncbi:MAG TPA: hypothetical protein VEJ63_09525 [Planctomycetota bacterium]|nr:hypothetical protein [Planctomycetota bacterium]